VEGLDLYPTYRQGSSEPEVRRGSVLYDVITQAVRGALPPKAIDELDPEDLADVLRLTQDGSPDFTADRKVSQITVSSRKL
jgi:hypothetical protein